MSEAGRHRRAFWTYLGALCGFAAAALVPPLNDPPMSNLVAYVVVGAALGLVIGSRRSRA
jgi:hypothetical protein